MKMIKMIKTVADVIDVDAICVYTERLGTMKLSFTLAYGTDGVT